MKINITLIYKPLYRALIYFSQKNKDILDKEAYIEEYGQYLIDFHHYFTWISNERDVSEYLQGQCKLPKLSLFH